MIATYPANYDELYNTGRQFQVATDYDAPRNASDETESIEAIKESQTAVPVTSDLDHDDSEHGAFTIAETIPDDMDDVVVIPVMEGEFTCMSCFIVKNRSQLANAKEMKCIDCA